MQTYEREDGTNNPSQHDHVNKPQRESDSSPPLNPPPPLTCPNGLTWVRGAEKGENKKIDTLSQILDCPIDQVFGEFAIIFNESKSQWLTDLQYLNKNKELVELMVTQLAFTKTSLYAYCQEIGFPVSQRTISTVIHVLFRNEILDVQHQETGLRAAEIYFFPASSKSTSFMQRLKNFFRQKFEKFKKTVLAQKGRKEKKKPKDPKEWARYVMEQKKAYETEKVSHARKERQEMDRNHSTYAVKASTQVNRIVSHLRKVGKYHDMQECNTCKHTPPPIMRQAKFILTVVPSGTAQEVP